MSPLSFESIISGPSSKKQGFTLVEMLASMVVLLFIIVILFQATSTTSRIYTHVTAETSSFEDAAASFQNITTTISMATLNTYTGYYPSQTPTGTGGTPPSPPQAYVRQSELHFVMGSASTLLGTSAQVNPTHGIFFQAPLGYTQDTGNTGLTAALNACGYYLAFGSDPLKPPLAILGAQTKYRFRLMEFIQPTEQLNVYASAYNIGDANASNLMDWFLKPINGGTGATSPVVRSIADNIVALILMPKAAAGDVTQDGLAAQNNVSPDYNYNSRINLSAPLPNNPPSQSVYPYTQQHQLPPIVSVTMVAIDEPSAAHIGNLTGSAPPTLWGNADAPFTTVAQYTQDIAHLINDLQNNSYKVKINYRVFRADIPIRAAKWNSP
jgi:uncharacterized protein (TIGR02599 family)